MKKDFSKIHSFFIDNESSKLTEYETERKAPVGYKPAYVEVKSKRVQLVFQPSIYKKARYKNEKTIKIYHTELFSLNHY